MSVELVGAYYGDSYGGNGIHNAAVGWSNLRIGQIYLDRKAGFRIDRNGVPIGWAPLSSLRFRGTIVVGLTVRVVR
jgi:hypothetical protein